MASVVEDRTLGVVAERDALVAELAGASGSASGRSAISSRSSRISKTRSPEAIARCDMPIHMPSIRSGMISIRT